MEDFFDTFSNKRDCHSIIEEISSIPSNYIGSKRRLLQYIINTLDEDRIRFDSVLDAFSGSAMVSLMFKMMGKRVYSNDILTSSSITAVCLMQMDDIPLSVDDIKFLCKNDTGNNGTFVFDNYEHKFFTEKECIFLDRYKSNIDNFSGEKFYFGMELINKATLMSIPNSNFSVYGKSLKNIRGKHTPGELFQSEKWRDTTRKRRDENNEIMFSKSLVEIFNKYEGVFPLSNGNKANKSCFSGCVYYDGQNAINIEHRIKHNKNKIQDISIDKDYIVFNSDIIDLLNLDLITADLLYLDPPYGGPSSDYTVLYRFLEEYLYGRSVGEIEHIQKGAKRFSKSNGYQAQFENLLSMCSRFKTWLISYNESSYANLDIIKSTIKNAGKTNIRIVEVPITYKYRKGKNIVDPNFKEYSEIGKKHLHRGTEYLILAT